MSINDVVLRNINPETSIIYAFNYIVIGIVSILFGFIASGRDGLMFELRVARGFHRVTYYNTLYICSIYSIILSLSQWNLNKDNDNCILEITNSSHAITITNKCSDHLYATNVLWIVILIVDAIYITTFLAQKDFRSAQTNKDRVAVRTAQKTQFIYSLIINIVRIILHIARFVLISYLSNTVSIILSSILFLIIIFKTIFHIRTISITSYSIDTFSTKLDINDLTLPSDNNSHPKKTQSLPMLGPSSSSSDDDIESQPARSQTISILKTKKHKKKPGDTVIF